VSDREGTGILVSHFFLHINSFSRIGHRQDRGITVKVFVVAKKEEFNMEPQLSPLAEGRKKKDYMRTVQ